MTAPVTDPTAEAPAPDEAPLATVRVAFWNVWLLGPRLWRGGPRVPDPAGWFGPEVAARAPLVAEAVAGRFDVVAFGEAWEDPEQLAMAAAWPESYLVSGPTRSLAGRAGSGLATLVGPDVGVVRVARLTYRARGTVRDADWLASKGALLVSVRVHPDLPPVEVVSTHLFAGGDLLPLSGHGDHERHHVVRMEQVDELVGFLGREHDPASPLLVVGDVNVPAHDRRTADPTVGYRDLAERLGWADLEDLWAAHGVGPGTTSDFATAADLPPDADDPDLVADDPDQDPAAAPGTRIDHLWLARPDGVSVTAERPRRWAFPGRGVTGGPAGSLSDHLAVSVTLHLSPS